MDSLGGHFLLAQSKQCTKHTKCGFSIKLNTYLELCVVRVHCFHDSFYRALEAGSRQARKASHGVPEVLPKNDLCGSEVCLLRPVRAKVLGESVHPVTPACACCTALVH